MAYRLAITPGEPAGIGPDIATSSSRPRLPIVRHHDERWDGQGYPDHLVGLESPLGARIAAIGDSWDAMVIDRPYRARLPLDQARGLLAAGAGQQWEAGLVEIFTGLLDGGLMRQLDPMQKPR